MCDDVVQTYAVILLRCVNGATTNILSNGSHSWVPHSSTVLTNTLARFITLSKDAPSFLRVHATRGGRLLLLFLYGHGRKRGRILRFLATLEFAGAKITAMLRRAPACNHSRCSNWTEGHSRTSLRALSFFTMPTISSLNWGRIKHDNISSRLDYCRVI
jgi:hypothetical protein